MEYLLKGLEERSWSRWLAPLGVLVVCLAAYLPLGRSAGSGDTLPARLAAVSLLTQGNFDLDEFAFARDEAAVATYPQMGGVPYYLRKRGDHFYSAYTVAPAVLALPVFAPFVAAGLDPASPRAAFVEKLSAALMVALSAAALFIVLGRRLSMGWALFLTAIYAFGTSSFATSSQGLWQHGPGQLCISLALLWMDPEARQVRPLLAALAVGGAVAMRNTNALLVLPLGIWLLWRHRSIWWKIAPAAAAFPAALLAYYLVVFASPGPEADDIHMGLLSGFRQIPLAEGLFGVLASPMRGLLFHTPVLVLSFAGAAVAFRRRDLFAALSFAGAALLVPLIAKWLAWWGGHCFGPRLLADSMPLWVLAAAPVLRLRSRWGTAARATAIALGAVSIAIGTLGAAMYDGRHDAYAFTDLRYDNMLRGGGGPAAFYATDLLGKLGLRHAPPTDFGPEPMDPTTGADGKPIPSLGDPASGQSFLAALVSAPVAAGSSAPAIHIAIEAPPTGADLGRLAAAVHTTNPGRPHAMNGWFLISDASGGLWNLQAGRFEPEAKTALRPWTGNSPLPYDVRIDLAAPLPTLPPGSHRLLFVLTDAANRRVEGRASAPFETAP